MTQKRISLLITDLDNTIFDWFSPWYHSFKNFVDTLHADTGIPLETLLGEFKEIHQRHGTAEYAFAIEELPSLQLKYPGEDLAKRFKSAIDDYKKDAQTHLKPYSGVVQSLKRIRETGCAIVAYTESMDIYTAYRINLLGLDGIFDYVFTSPNHDVPKGYDNAKISRYTVSSVTLEKTTPGTTPAGEKKPNPHILLDIIDQVGGLPSWTAYVGDNLWKDIHMAQEAGVLDCHAVYGMSHLKSEYDLLKKVTHWTDEDVHREKSTDSSGVKPTVSLIKFFDEIFQVVQFVKPGDEVSVVSDQALSRQVELWKQTVSVQMHFNEIEMKIRNLALTFVGAAVGITGLALKEDIQIPAFDSEYPLAAFVCLGTSIVLLSFWFMDRLWYHRLLNGSVQHGVKIEKYLADNGHISELTDAIGANSPVDFLCKRFHSKAKISLFYFSLSAFLSMAGGWLTSGKVGIWISVFWLLVTIFFFFKQPNKPKKAVSV